MARYSPTQRDWVGMTRDQRLNFSYMAGGPAEVLAASREILCQGASFIKIMVGDGVGSWSDPIDSKQMAPELENIDLIGDPAKNFVVIMKDGKIYKNTIRKQ